jgi:PEGA domain
MLYVRRGTLLTFLAVTAAAGLAAGCATIMQGTSQELSVASTPTGARVLVDGTEMGKTPYVANLKRKDKHVVRIEMDGYQPYELPLARGTSGWVWGNLVFGGIPGLAIDAISGGLYKLKPDQVDATLAQQSAVVGQRGDVIVLAVVLRADPEWQQIGALTPQ